MTPAEVRAPFDAAFLARLETLHLLARRIFSGRMNARHISKKLGPGTDFADHRLYNPGDDLRLLDWNAYARTGRLYMKLYRQEEDRNLFFLVDQSASMAAEPAKFDYARRLAAALTYIGLSELDRVFLMSFGAGICAARPSLRGRRSILEALDFLARLSPGGQTDFREVARHFIGRHGAKEGLVLVLSDFLDLDGVRPGLDALFGQGFEVVAIQIVTPAELDPRLLGEWRLQNPEGGPRITAHLTRRVVARYREELRRMGEGLRRHLSSRRGGYVRAVTSIPLEDLVLRELRRGRLLG